MCISVLSPQSLKLTTGGLFPLWKLANPPAQGIFVFLESKLFNIYHHTCSLQNVRSVLPDLEAERLYFYFLIKKYFLYLCLERGEGREKERE